MSVSNILLVDDNRNLGITLSEGLHKAMGKATSIVVCFSASEALSVLATQSFDVVISECNLPGESGLELLVNIRHNYPETILVLTSTYEADGLEEKVRRLGIGYVAKPFGIPFLVQVIHALLYDKENRDEKGNAPRTLTPDHEDGNADMLDDSRM